MRKSILIASLLLTFTPLIRLEAQTRETCKSKMPIDEKTGLFTYVKVQEIPGSTAATLYLRGLAWAMKYYKNPVDVIRQRDSISNTIVCKARFRISNPPDKKGIATDAGMVMYTLKIQCKDGRYRYELSEINWKQTSYFPAERWMDTNSALYRDEYACYLQQTEEETKKIIGNLEKAMQEKEAARSEDW